MSKTDDMISRKAAIDAFDGVKVDEEDCTDYDIGYNDGIDSAVSKLSVLPSAQPVARDTNVLSNDLVSRQVAIDALGERPAVWIDDDEYSLGQRNQYDCDKLAIETVPSAQPERKRGKWIHENTLKYFFCSECGEPSLTDDDRYIYSMDFPNFCPNCGADMRGEEE